VPSSGRWARPPIAAAAAASPSPSPMVLTLSPRRTHGIEGAVPMRRQQSLPSDVPGRAASRIPAPALLGSVAGLSPRADARQLSGQEINLAPKVAAVGDLDRNDLAAFDKQLIDGHGTRVSRAAPPDDHPVTCSSNEVVFEGRSFLHDQERVAVEGSDPTSDGTLEFEVYLLRLRPPQRAPVATHLDGSNHVLGPLSEGRWGQDVSRCERLNRVRRQVAAFGAGRYDPFGASWGGVCCNSVNRLSVDLLGPMSVWS
jgi:hypothetical protein